MASRKKYVVLNMQQRLDVLKDLEEAVLSPFAIAMKYGVDIKTIRRIAANAMQINTFADKSKEEKKRRRIVNPVYDELDRNLAAWFIERRTLGDHLRDALLMEKAAEMKEGLPSCSTFTVSRGWFEIFKIRHNIRLLHAYGEKASADNEAAIVLINSFTMKVSIWMIFII